MAFKIGFNFLLKFSRFIFFQFFPIFLSINHKLKKYIFQIIPALAPPFISLLIFDQILKLFTLMVIFFFNYVARQRTIEMPNNIFLQRQFFFEAEDLLTLIKPELWCYFGRTQLTVFFRVTLLAFYKILFIYFGFIMQHVES